MRAFVYQAAAILGRLGLHRAVCSSAPAAGHYRYEPRPVAVARGNEKGRVERSIGYIRSAFFAARSFADLDDLNAQADEVRHLLSLPDNPVPLLERVAVKVDKTPCRSHRWASWSGL